MTKRLPAPEFVALAGAALLICQWAGGRPFWVDEEMLALNLRDRSFLELAGRLWLDQSAPLGWLALQRLVLLTAGTSEQALRLVPLLFGLGTLAASAWIGRRWLGDAGGAILALLCSFGPWLAYHALELKPYSADAFWGLLLPGLAAWTVEATDAAGNSRWKRRLALWWAVAVVGQWFGNGAMLVTPACALVLHLVLWRRQGSRSVLFGTVAGLAWIASFALHYHLALRYTVTSQALQAYWSFALPPAASGIPDTVRWLAGRFGDLANKPAGAGYPLLFWAVAATGAGLAIIFRPAAGVMLAAVPLSAFVWAGLRLMPMYERLSLWILPSLYAAIAVVAAVAARLGRRAVRRRRAGALGLALLAAVPVCLLSVDVVRHGYRDLTSRPTNDNHRVDDRGGIRWLLKQRQAGDVVLTTHLALPAVWWYGDLLISSTGPHSPAPRGIPIFEANMSPPGPGCPQPLRDALGHPQRLLVYLGFRSDDWPDAHEDLLFRSLAEIGSISQYRHFAETGGAMVVDLRQPPPPGAPLPLRPWTRAPVSRPPGCIRVKPAEAW